VDLSAELAIGNWQLAKKGFVNFRGNRQLAIGKRRIRELSWK